MTATKREPWPFEWPPAPGATVELWLPELGEAALRATYAKMSNEPLKTVLSAHGLRVSDRTGVATIAGVRPFRGGTAVSVSLRRRRWLPEPLSFDHVRHPIAAVLGTLFVIGLGFGPPVPANIYRGCVALMIGASSIIIAMWGLGYHLQARENAQRASTRCLQGLGRALAELGARPLPANDSPFRR